MQVQSAFNRLSDAAAWRVRRLLGDGRIDRAWVAVARRWRPALKRPVFIGVTGSAGKTTTKELLFGILSAHRKGVASPGSLNVLPEVAKTVMRVRPNHDFCVVELSEAAPGVMVEHLGLLSPSIAIVTVVQSDHVTAFGSIDGLAEEMSRLVEALPSSGTAVLNADDPRVFAMSARCHCNVLTYGMSPHAQLRAEDITSVWPDRLQMTLLWQGERVPLKTQLCGAHWLAAVLGAVGGALATGLTLQECVLAMANLPSFEGRMQPLATPEGVTFIRDDYKAPLWTLDACFDFMKTAQAKRKIIVIGELSDVVSKKAAKFANAARLSQEVADITVFVGPWASSALKARRPDVEGNLRMFAHVRDAAEFINAISQAGDLILLKGSVKQDHLHRIILARSKDIACWRDDCDRNMFCSECSERMKPSGAVLLQQHPVMAANIPSTALVTLHDSEQVVVGLGNPAAQYANTPHNIGYAVVDQLAQSLGLEWIAMPGVLFARGGVQGHGICLIKVNANMNLIGAELKKLADEMAFHPAQCILVYDDLDLPLGTVRTRLSGSAGGHRGVASILEAFQTDGFKRVKVGVGQTNSSVSKIEYVLKPFDAASGEAVAKAVAVAVARLLEIAKTQAATKDNTKVL